MFWISVHLGGITEEFATRFGPQLFSVQFNRLNDPESIISFTLKWYKPMRPTCFLAQEVFAGEVMS